MGHYYGLPAIARRMGVARSTVMDWYERRGFLMLMRRRGLRRCYYTNDGLILAWEAADANATRAAREQRLAARGALNRLKERPLGARRGGRRPA